MKFNLKEVLIRFFNRPVHVASGVMVLMILLAMLVDWRGQTLLWQSAHNEIHNSVLPLRDQLMIDLQKNIGYLDTLRTYLELDLTSADIQVRFQSLSAGLSAGEKDVKRFNLLSGGVIHATFPLAGQEDYLGTNITSDLPENMRADIQRAIQTRQVVVSRPMIRNTGTLVLISQVALYDDRSYWGMVSEIVNLEPLLSSVGLSPVPENLRLALRDSKANVFWGDAAIFENSPVILPVDMPGEHWELAAMPAEGWVPHYFHLLLLERLVVTSLATLITILAFSNVQRQQHLNGTVKERNVQLERQSQDHKRVEALLQQTEAFTAAVLDNSLQAFVLLDLNLKVLLVNRTARQWADKFTGENLAPGHPFQGFLEPEWWEEFLECFNRALLGESFSVYRVLQYPGHPERSFDFSFYPILINDKDIIGICISAMDLTEYKRTEESLHQSEKRFMEIFQANPAAIGIINLEKHTVVTINERMENMLGLSNEAVAGKKIEEISLWTNPADLEEFEKQFEDHQSIRTWNTHWETGTAGVRDLSISISPIMLGGEKCQLFMALDDTERHRSEIEREQLLDQVQAGRERLRELTRQLVNVQEEERRRISRELHDEAGQALTALSISLEMLQSNLVTDQDEFQQRMGDAVELTHNTLDQIRSLAQNLRPPALDALGLVPALRGQCQAFHRRTGIQVSTFFEEGLDLPETHKITFYRCLQEALTNVARHAHADHVWVELRTEENEVWLTVTDDGQGIRASRSEIKQLGPKGLGLIGLQERLELLEGRLEVETNPGQGMRLVARLPKP